jgi:4a-hydroxytetrahydrobiopterin dehydratase
MSELAKKECVPSSGEDVPLKGSELDEYLNWLGGGWQTIEEHHLEKTYKFKDFRRALEFTNRVGELAEAVNHHPEMSLGWGFVSLTIWTHAIGGLHEADFIFAAKADLLRDEVVS